MLELSILKLLLKKDNFIKYNSIITKLNTEKEIRILIYLIIKYYDEFDNHYFISIDELKTYFYLNYPSERNSKEYELIFDRLASLDISDSVASNVVRQYIEYDCATKIVDKLLPIVQGQRGDSVFEIPTILEEYKHKALMVDDVASPFLDDDFSNIQELLSKKQGLSWRLKCMNDNIGPLSRTNGSLGHIFARPESGKTSFVASEITRFAEQLHEDELCLYVWNEETGARVRNRLIQASLNLSTQEIEDMFLRLPNASEELQHLFYANGGNKILIPKEGNLSYEDILALVEKYKNIKVLVIDIADHVLFRKSGDMAGHERLEELYRRLRSLSNTYNINVITVAQAAESASDKKHLYMEHMANSKTGKPGALDYAIGIGKTNNSSEDNLRWISIPKNKIGCTVSSINAVYFDKLRGRYSEI